MEDLIKEFLAESREGLDRMDLCLTALEERPRDKDLLGEIFRAVHTMKGATGFLGYPRLERLAHSGETLLSLMRDGVLIADAALIDALFQLTDRLRDVIDLIERIGREGNRASDDDSEMILMLERLHPGADSDADFAGMMVDVGVKIGAETGHANVHRSEAATPADVEETVAEPLLTVPEQAEPSPEAPQRVGLESEWRDAETTVRVDVQVLDRMVHLVGELVLTRNRLLMMRTDESGAAQAAERLDTLTQELRQTVMQARMLPLAQLFRRFPRMVRDLAKQCSKSVRIEFTGQETALDRTLIEAIKEPLAHTLRNAIDHGIEAAYERFTAGKPEEGVVRLCASQQSGWVMIEVSDDGAGLSRQRLIARAVERGLLTEEQAGLMSEAEVMDLVFEPGFSTAAAVTHISGRGVGMDVVRSQVERVGGSVEIESTEGVGTVVRLRVPLTLAIVPAWTVRVGAHSFCIPQNALAELACVHYRDAELLCGKVHAAEVYRLRDELLPMVSLDDVLGLPRQRGMLGFYVAIVNVDGLRFALIVDDVIAAEEIVVKPVSSIVRALGVYSGATVLGGGDLAMVLDMPSIAMKAGMRNQGRRETVLSTAAVADNPTVLLAEIDGLNGIPQRVAFAIETVERIERIPMAIMERIGDRLVMPYRNEVLSIEDTANIFGIIRSSGEATVLICLREDGSRGGVLVSRVIEVTTADRELTAFTLEPPQIRLLDDRLTLMRDFGAQRTSVEKRWTEVA